jgi:hypothetical protein
LVVSTTSVLPFSQWPRLSPSQLWICAGIAGRPSVGMIRVSWTISICSATTPGDWKMRIPLLYMNGNIDAGRPRVMHLSQVSKSVQLSNGCPRRQLERISPASRLPSAVYSGRRPFAGDVIHEVRRLALATSAQWPMPIFPWLSSFW